MVKMKPSDEESFRKVARINPAALNMDGTLKSFFEQYGEAEMRRASEEDFRLPGPYVLAFDGAFTGIETLCDKPIVFPNKSLKHVLKKHGATIEMLSNLTAEIEAHVLAYENPEDENKITFVLDARSAKSNDIITVLRTDLVTNQVEVSSIRSVHGRARSLLLSSMGEALDRGRRFYLNKKSGAWLEIQKHIPDETGVAKEVLSRLTDILYQNETAEQPQRKPPLDNLTQIASVEKTIETSSVRKTTKPHPPKAKTTHPTPLSQESKAMERTSRELAGRKETHTPKTKGGR